MICKNCGQDNPSPWFDPVYRPGLASALPRNAPTDMDQFVRWACRRCERYHCRDGSLWPPAPPSCEEAP